MSTLLLTACDQQPADDQPALPLQQIEQMRREVAHYGEKVQNGTAARGDSLQYVLQSLTASYVEPAYFPERISDANIQRSEQMVQMLGKNGGGLTRDQLKQVAAELGTPFFYVLSGDNGHEVGVLDLGRVPFEHIAHLQPVMISYSLTTSQGNALMQMVLPGSFDLIQDYMSSMGFGEDILAAVPASSGKIAGDRLPWEVEICEPGDSWHYIMHADYGLYPSCSIAVEAGYDRPILAPIIICPGCDRRSPGPVQPINPHDPWLPHPGGGLLPPPQRGPESKAYKLEPITDIVALTPNGRSSLRVMSPRGAGEGAAYEMESGIGYQIVPVARGADINAVTVTDARTTATMARQNLVSTTGSTVGAGFSGDPRSVGFDFSYRRESSATLQSDQPVYVDYDHEHPKRPRDVYMKTARFACWGRTIETQLRLQNKAFAGWEYRYRGIRVRARGNEQEERTVNVPCYYKRY